MKALFFFFYERIIWPAIQALLPLAALFVPKIKAGLNLRKADLLSQKKLDKCVWIHVSSGEWEYARPLARLLKLRGEKILVTHFSPSIRKPLESSSDVDVVFSAPFDSQRSMQDFFNRFSPKILLIARTDIWPVMLRETKLRQIPTALFSATLSNDVLASHSSFSKFLSSLKLSFVDQIFCVSPEDQENLNKLLGCNKAIAIGDTRYDQVVHRLQNPKNLKNIFESDHRYFVCGSTWQTDEEILVPALKGLSAHLKTVVVPHEPTAKHLEELEKILGRNGLSYERYSRFSGQAQVVVVDEVGILAELYLKADFAFVGNSFERNAVHSVMEPLAAGCLTFVGPGHRNNREAIEFSSIALSNGYKAVEVIRNSDELALKLKGLLALPNSKQEISQLVRSRTGASLRLLDSLVHFR